MGAGRSTKRLAGSGPAPKTPEMLAKEKEIQDLLAQQQARLSANQEQRDVQKNEARTFRTEELKPVKQELRAVQQELGPPVTMGYRGAILPSRSQLTGDALAQKQQQRQELLSKYEALRNEAKQKRKAIKQDRKEDRFFRNRELSPLERDFTSVSSRPNMASYDQLLERARQLGQV